MVRFVAPLAVLLGLAGSCLAAGQKPTYLISFHEEGESMESPRTLQELAVNGEKRYFRKSPVLTQRNFRAYWAFPAEDGQSWGAVFWLDTPGQHRVERLGVANRGQYLAAVVNMQPVDVQTIDKAPADGRIVVWKGLPAKLFEVIDKEKKMRRIGEPPSADRAATAARRTRENPTADPTAVPAGEPLPDDAVVGDIAPRELAAATRDITRPSAPAKKPVRSSRPAAVDPIPFKPDPTVERPDLVPLPEPGPKRQ